MKSYTVCVCYCVCACLKLLKVRCKSSNKGVRFLRDGGRKAGDFNRLKGGERKQEGKNEMSMKQGAMRGGWGKRKGKSEVKRRRWWWGDADFHAGCCPTFQFSSCLLHAFPKSLVSPTRAALELSLQLSLRHQTKLRGKWISQPVSCVSKQGSGLMFGRVCNYLRWYESNTSPR